MKLPPPSECPETIRALARQLEMLEGQLGDPSAPVDLDEKIVRIAHDLRTELTLYHLARHLDGRRCCV